MNAHRGLRYVVLVFALWAFMPEIRRLIDWRIGFEPIPLTAALPLVSLAPFAFVALRRSCRVPEPMRYATWLWLGGFVYALGVAVLSSNSAAALYAFALFTLPVFAGLWISTVPSPPIGTLRYIARATLWIAFASSAYGIYQYIAPPPWDAFWMTHVGTILGGSPVPFQVRVFGTLNSAGPFADFVALALVLTVARRRFSALTAVQILVCLTALGLSSVRSAWIMLVVGVTVYALFAPRALGIVRGVTALVLAAAVLFVMLPALVGDPNVSAGISQRAGTLSNLASDQSANSRADQTAAAAREGLSEPLGRGLGVLGTATKLASSSQQLRLLDSGYLSRFVEMGVPGFAAIVLSTVLIVLVLLRVPRSIDSDTRVVTSVAVAVQISLVWLDVSGDARSGFLGVFAWVVTGLAMRALADLKGAGEAPLHIVVPWRGTLLRKAPASP